MKLVSILLGLILSTAFADTHFAPAKFKHKNKPVVFVDFHQVDTLITYDLDNAKAIAQSIIKFSLKENGNPLFDTKAKILTAKLNGQNVHIKLIDSPDRATQYQMIDKEIIAGEHELIIENIIDTNINFSKSSVQSAFWMSDLTDRKYLEQYLPTNLEFDHYQMNMEVKVIGMGAESHEIFTNGALNKIATNHFQIKFPDYFTTSSFYFHLSKEGVFESVNTNFNSISGKNIPVVVYARDKASVQTGKVKSIEVLNELENKLGAWSHSSLTVYIAGQGGMEHAGATMTSLWALGHEITHSFFARGVMPADGNSGWMDEAIASWRDDGYKTVSSPNFRSTQMSGHSQYSRTTDRKAYRQGANFMAYLNHRLSNQGGLINFLNKMHGQYVHQSISTHLFKKELEIFTGENFTAEFNRYIFGLKTKHSHQAELEIPNPYHVKLSKAELEDLL